MHAISSYRTHRTTPPPCPSARYNVSLSLGLSECAEAHTETVHIREVVNKKCCDNDCLGKLPLDLIRATREQSRELQVRCDYHVDHLHLVLLGHMDACLHDGDVTDISKRKNLERKYSRLAHTFHGKPICSAAFLAGPDVSNSLM